MTDLLSESDFSEAKVAKAETQPFFITIVEDVGGMKDVPMESTVDIDVQQVRDGLREAVVMVRESLGPDATFELIPAKKSLKKSPKPPRGCELIAQFTEGLQVEKRMSNEGVINELLALKGEQINFKNVVTILFKRWKRNYSSYFRDEQVASLVLRLREMEESKNGKIDHLIRAISSNQIPSNGERRVRLHDDSGSNGSYVGRWSALENAGHDPLWDGSGEE